MTRASLLILVLLASALAADAQSSSARMISAPKFEMPAEARAAGIDGMFTLLLKVGADGVVTDADVIAGPSWPCGKEPKKELAELRKTVVAQSLASKFAPAIKDGRPHPTTVQVRFAIGETFDSMRQTADRIAAIERGEFAPDFVKAGLLNGKAEKLPKPYYPAAARGGRVSGMVTVDVLVDEKGNVARAGIISGAAMFHDAGRTAACEAKFAPKTLGGRPVKVSGFLQYAFLPSM